MNTSNAPGDRSATDERIDENREPAAVAPATRNSNESERNGLPPGTEDSRESPLDGAFFDPDKRYDR